MNEFYTVNDILLLTDLSIDDVNTLIDKLNQEIIDRCKKYHLTPTIRKGRILKDYFMKRMEN